MILYRVGDATAPQGSGNIIITHCANDAGAWGAGFVVALSRRWPSAERAYRCWHRGSPTNAVETGPFELGQVQYVQVEPNTWVASIIGQSGVGWDSGPPIRYPAIESGLIKVETFAKEISASVAMPRMGAGLAGGDWAVIERLVNSTLVDKGIGVTVYDLPR